MKPYKISFRNIAELNNISLNFSDVKNVLDSEVGIDDTGRTVINSNVNLTYEINDINRQNEINDFFSKQIIKIRKRKKAIFEAFIKDRDSLLESGNDNKQVDYFISVTDLYNFFGKRNIVMEMNDRAVGERYNKILEEAVDKLLGIYKKRLENFSLKSSENMNNDTDMETEDRPDGNMNFESIKNRNSGEKDCKQNYNALSKYENQKKEINQSYIFAKIFNYIRKNLEYPKPYIIKNKDGENEVGYEKGEFLAEIPLINGLNLNFSENTVNTDDNRQLAIIKRNVLRAGLLFDRERKRILIPCAFLENNEIVYEVKRNIFREEITESGEFSVNEIPKKMLLKRAIYEKFREIMSKKRVLVKSGKYAGEYYGVDIKLYNINTEKISLTDIVKSVVFKEIIDELRPYIEGICDEKGNRKKKSIRLNDMEKISEIADYKKRQIELLFMNREKNIFRKIEDRFSKLERQYLEQTENEEMKRKIREDMNVNMEREKKNCHEHIEKIKKGMDRNLSEFERKNRDFSFNFKIKNVRKKKEKNFEKREKIIAIFLEDVYNIINRYKNMNVDTNFLFIKVFMKLSEKFNFVVPFVREYGDKISDRSVTIAFFNSISNVNIFLKNIVYNAIDIHIIKDKYKIFRKNNEKKDMIYLNDNGKVAKMKVTYSEYLEYKYRKKYRLSKKNPFEIDSENVSEYGKKYPNSYKYHRILGENVKYLFININSQKILKINSQLFKNYTMYIDNMIVLDGVISSGNRILHEEMGERNSEMTIRNFIPENNRFDIYVNEKYIETTHYNISMNRETNKSETVEQRLRKILAKV